VPRPPPPPFPKLGLNDTCWGRARGQGKVHTAKHDLQHVPLSTVPLLPFVKSCPIPSMPLVARVEAVVLLSSPCTRHSTPQPLCCANNDGNKCATDIFFGPTLPPSLHLHSSMCSRRRFISRWCVCFCAFVLAGKGVSSGQTWCLQIVGGGISKGNDQAKACGGVHPCAGCVQTGGSYKASSFCSVACPSEGKCI
jgi:hypothetical protein